MKKYLNILFLSSGILLSGCASLIKDFTSPSKDSTKAKEQTQSNTAAPVKAVQTETVATADPIVQDFLLQEKVEVPKNTLSTEFKAEVNRKREREIKLNDAVSPTKDIKKNGANCRSYRCSNQTSLPL